MTPSSDARAVLHRAIEQDAGRLAKGNPTECAVEDVRVLCHHCGGITVFPVLKDGGIRPTPAPCCHCGKDI